MVKDEKNRGSMAIETMIVLLVFIAAVSILFKYARLTLLQFRLQTALNETTKEVSFMNIFSIEALDTDKNGIVEYDFSGMSNALSAVKGEMFSGLSEEERYAFLTVCYGNGVENIRDNYLKSLFLKKLEDADPKLNKHLMDAGLSRGKADIRNIKIETDGKEVKLTLSFEAKISFAGLGGRGPGVVIPIEIHSRMRLWKYENEAMSAYRRMINGKGG